MTTDRLVVPGSSSELAWFWFDDGAVVFDHDSGDTHALSRDCAQWLQSLRGVGGAAIDEPVVPIDVLALLRDKGLV